MKYMSISIGFHSSFSRHDIAQTNLAMPIPFGESVRITSIVNINGKALST